MTNNSFTSNRFFDPESGNGIIWRNIPADLDTPVSLMLKLTRAGKMSFLLESVTGGETRARYSAVGMTPDLIWRCHGDKAEINRHAFDKEEAFTEEKIPALDSLRAIIDESRIALPPELPPLACGLFGVIGYDMARLAERLPEPNPDPLQLPDAILMRPSIIAIHDLVTDTLTLAAPIWAYQRSDRSQEESIKNTEKLLEEAIEKLSTTPVARTRYDLCNAAEETPDIEPKANRSRDEFMQIVEKARRYIGQGDIFQVVPSLRWQRPFSAAPFSLYRALRRTNPSPYMFFFNFGDFQLVGTSPEILIKLQDKKITLRPLAGTRRRGTSTEEDLALERELLADPKERAEHLMLLDLGRNDVGRVAKIGSVDPNIQFAVERYSHVMHIVSNVEGELDEQYDALSALLAALPAGTLSGAPKIRAMEIIDELEPIKRGVAYAGAAGYFSSGGDMDNCIILRTALLKDGIMYVQSGAGVVWDSDPQSEYDETRHKAKALFAAASQAELYKDQW